MSKLYAQKLEPVLASSATLTAGNTVTGSMHTAGHSKLVGILYSNASSTASGLRIQQSANYGVSWDYETLYTISPSVASAFSVDICGNAIRITASNGATAASLFRAWFAARPI